MTDSEELAVDVNGPAWTPVSDTVTWWTGRESGGTRPIPLTIIEKPGRVP